MQVILKATLVVLFLKEVGVILFYINANYRNKVSMLVLLQKTSKILIVYSEGGETPKVLKRVWRENI